MSELDIARNRLAEAVMVLEAYQDAAGAALERWQQASSQDRTARATHVLSRRLRLAEQQLAAAERSHQDATHTLRRCEAVLSDCQAQGEGFTRPGHCEGGRRV